MNTLSQRTRITIAVVVAAVLAAIAIGYTLLAADPRHDGDGAPEPAAEQAALAAGPRLQVLSNGRLSTVARNDPRGPRVIAPLQCDRAYAAAGTVACLRPVGPLKNIE